MELINDGSTGSYVSKAPVFYIDRNFNVYPNITSPGKAWLLENLKTDGAETVLKNYAKSFAQHTRLTVPLCTLVEAHGDPKSRDSCAFIKDIHHLRLSIYKKLCNEVKALHLGSSRDSG